MNTPLTLDKTSFCIPLPGDFQLPHAIERYGFYELAPNRWDAQKQTFARPLTLASRPASPVRIVCRQDQQTLMVRLCSPVGRKAKDEIGQQVRRMFRIDENFDAWYRMHPAARRRRFGRLFRSPTLFEDMVKTLTTCNINWPGTHRMNLALCRLGTAGAFPSPAELAQVGADRLLAECGVGYRAAWIIDLADRIRQGRIDLAEFEVNTLTDNALELRLRKLPGVGRYAAANLMMLLGRYSRLAFDTEMASVARNKLGLQAPATPAGTAKLRRMVDQHYQPWQPYPFLAYWYDLLFAPNRPPAADNKDL